MVKNWFITLPHLYLILLTISFLTIPLNTFQTVYSNNGKWSVIEDDDFITVENRFYKAEIRKSTLYNYEDYGEVEHLYIKPDGNDVSPPGDSIKGIGGHEYMTLKPVEEDYYQFHSHGDVTPVDLSVIKNETDYCIIYNKFILNAKIVSQYYVFYRNRPYYLVNVEHEWNTPPDTVVWQNQMCMLIAYQWADTLIYLDQDGTVVNYSRPATGKAGVRSFAKMPVEQRNRTYLWAYYYNSTFREGIGFIFLDVLPRGENTYVDYWIDSGSEADYTEIQLTIGGPYGYCGYIQYNSEIVGKDYYSYIVYVTNDDFNLTYRDVQTLARDLWSSNYEKANAVGFAGAGRIDYHTNQSCWRYTWGSYACRTYLQFNPDRYDFRWISWGDYPQGTTLIISEWQNTTGAYNCFDEVHLTAGYNSPRADYANITWSNTRETLTTTVTWEYYNDSDKAILLIDYRIDGNLTVSRMGLYLGGDSNYTYSQLNATVWKGERTDAILGYEGIIIYDLTGESKIEAIENGLCIFCVDRDWNDTTYMDKEFKMKLWLQPYISSTPMNLTLMKEYDGLHESRLNQFENHYVKLWNTTHDLSENFQVLDLINKRYALLHHDFDSEKEELILTVRGVGEFQLKCPDKGKPISVEYSDGKVVPYTYDESTETLTLNLNSPEITEIVVSWGKTDGETRPISPIFYAIIAGELTIIVFIYVFFRKKNIS